jgi:hypothetical protein
LRVFSSIFSRLLVAAQFKADAKRIINTLQNLPLTGIACIGVSGNGRNKSDNG